MDEVLDLSIEGAVATVTLNRPHAGNALDLAMARALLQAAIHCDTDEAVRCVVLTVAGKLFCAGGDISAFETARETMPALLSELAGTVHMAVSRFQRMRKPLLVLDNGPVAGAGLSLAIGGDIVIAARTAHFYRGLWRDRAQPRWRHVVTAAATGGDAQSAGDDHRQSAR